MFGLVTCYVADIGQPAWKVILFGLLGVVCAILTFMRRVP
jgi:hypothetical protein